MNEQIYNMSKETSSTIFSKKELLSFYEEMLLIRKFETVAQENFKKGEIPGFIHLCIGQEAVAVGICHQLRKTDWITSTHRGHGHALAKGLNVSEALAELYGKVTGCNGGRGGSMHLYSLKDGVFGTNGLVGGGLPLAVGLGMSEVQRGRDNVAVAFFGDGAVNHASFHESIGLAAMRNTPVIFVCENNLYATCTPYAIAGKNISIAGKAAAYGIEGVRVDGNDVLAVHRVMEIAVLKARSGGGPTLIEASTYRTVGHYEGDVVAGVYRSLAEVEEWKSRCPIKRYEAYLLKEGITPEEIASAGVNIEDRIRTSVEFARNAPFPDKETVNDHCYQFPVNPSSALQQPSLTAETSLQSWLTAVRDGIMEEMRRDPNILYLGEGIGERGGSFGHTKNIWQEFGDGRVIDTPICESAFTGAAAAASATGCRTVADLMYADFVFEAASQIVNQASKLRYISNGQINVPMVIRAGAGQIKQAGPQHSGTFHPVWAHIPGLIVVIPSTPADAKGLIKTALRAGDPVIFLEPKALFATKGHVPQKEHLVPFGKARLVESGTDITIVSFGLPVLTATTAVKQLKEEGLSCELLDLRTIVPLDLAAIRMSLEKTGRLLIVEESYSICSFSAEIAAQIVGVAFDKLKAPVGRLNQGSVPQPFSPALETAVGISVDKVKEAVKDVLAGRPKPMKILAVSNVDDSSIAGLSSGGADEQKYIAQSDPSSQFVAGAVPVAIPNIGLTITEVQITQWYKRSGDIVCKGEELLEFESEKSNVALEAEVSGKLKVLRENGSTVAIGEVVGYIAPEN
ncbi:MAG: thiamine pyrophosphate-dependent enzyme [Chitinophagaceae bacterium]|nr:thiamine pyrophosphate-dependent enzyme [Chitinophagaceae bacterium]